MPPSFLIDLASIDLNAVLFGQEAIRELNPQRGDMEHLDAIVWADPDKGQILGRKDVKENEFWVPGHIPGRPLLPGVIMLEAAAQLASFYTKKYVGWPGFIGFGGLGDTKFRSAVTPGQTLYLLSQKTWDRHKRIGCNVQGVVNGNLVFETSIIGTQM
ncbi:MAG: 3-hydroxyacyl-ACP dehydratase FabZ family protein [Tepidisphaeraceae bacterium]